MARRVGGGPGAAAARARHDLGRSRLDNTNDLTTIVVRMTPRRRFELEYAPLTQVHLQAIEPKHYSLIRKTIEEQLPFEPDVETKNRKPLKRPAGFGAHWELRLGPDNRFRVFYRIDYELLQVTILAIGEKRGERLMIGGEVVRL